MDDMHGFIAIVCGGRLGVHCIEGENHPDTFGTSLLHWLHTADLTVLRVSAGAMLAANRPTPGSEELDNHARWMGPWVREPVGDAKLTWIEVMAGISATAKPTDGSAAPDADLASRSSQVGYGYLLDFDANLFEVHRGGQSTMSYGRFGKVEGDFPARRIAAWPLSALPPTEVGSHWWHWASQDPCPAWVPCWMPPGAQLPGIAAVVAALSAVHANWATALAALDADGEVEHETTKYDETKTDYARDALDEVERWFELLTVSPEPDER